MEGYIVHFFIIKDHWANPNIHLNEKLLDVYQYISHICQYVPSTLLSLVFILYVIYLLQMLG